MGSHKKLIIHVVLSQLFSSFFGVYFFSFSELFHFFRTKKKCTYFPNSCHVSPCTLIQNCTEIYMSLGLSNKEVHDYPGTVTRYMYVYNGHVGNEI